MTRMRCLIVCGLLLASGGPGCRPPERNVRNLVLTGSPGMTPLLREIGKRFEESHADVHVDVQTRGSTTGAVDARQGLADIGMVARVLKPDESTLHAIPIARDGVCFVVHRSNPVASLRDDQIVNMYTRGVSNWKEVGGPDRPITLIHMADGGSIAELFLDHLKLKSTQIRADAIVQSSEQGVQAVAERPGAIGYVSCSHVKGVGEKVPIRTLPSGGIEPTAEHVHDGTYPLSRPLNLVTRDEPKGLAKEFIDFARSNAAVDLIEKYHYVPLEK
ncbi:MAG TPA: phosphate ABC transporter substrate-binding protein [Gemmataceae bacterium]